MAYWHRLYLLCYNINKHRMNWSSINKLSNIPYSYIGKEMALHNEKICIHPVTIWNIKLLHVLIKAAACEESMPDNKSGAKINQDKQCVRVTHLSPMSSKLVFSTTVPRSENDLQKISEPLSLLKQYTTVYWASQLVKQTFQGPSSCQGSMLPQISPYWRKQSLIGSLEW